MIQARELVGDGPDDLNPIWRECGKKLEEDPLAIKVAGTSITVIQYELK